MTSDVFKDMFSLPASDPNTDQAQPIFIDEKAEVLALTISDLQTHQSRTGPSSGESHGLAINHSVLKALDKYQVTEGRTFKRTLLPDSPMPAGTLISISEGKQLHSWTSWEEVEPTSGT